jgi:hypothetical protein
MSTLQIAPDRPLRAATSPGARQPNTKERLWWSEIALPLAGYGILAAICFLLTRQTLNYDGLCYLENARRMASGDWAGAVSGYWSPVISAVISGFIRVGMDPLDSAHLAQILAGLLFVISVSLLLRRTTRLTWPAKQVILALTSLFAVSETALWITPDVLAAAILLVYVHASGPRGTPLTFGRALFAGAVAGAAYLTKYFALPLFVAHWCALSALRVVASRGQRLRTTAVCAAGVLGFALVSGPWIAVLSAKYQRPTFSIQSPYALYLGGPNGDVDRPLDRIQSPIPGRLTIWETPDRLIYEPWRPLAGTSQLLAHLKRCVKRVHLLCSQFQMVDSLCTFPSLLIVLALVAHRMGHTKLVPSLLHVLFFTVLCGAGYCAIYLNEFDCRRYVFTLAFPLHLVACAGASWELGWWQPSAVHESSTLSRIVRPGLMAALILAFALPSLERLAMQTAFLPPQSSSMAAKALAEMGCSGPLATSGVQSWLSVVPVAWRLQAEGAGCVPENASFDSAMADLVRTQVETFIVEPDWPHRQRLSTASNWELVGQLRICATAPAFDVFRRTGNRSEPQHAALVPANSTR